MKNYMNQYTGIRKGIVAAQKYFIEGFGEKFEEYNFLILQYL